MFLDLSDRRGAQAGGTQVDHPRTHTKTPRIETAQSALRVPRLLLQAHARGVPERAEHAAEHAEQPGELPHLAPSHAGGQLLVGSVRTGFCQGGDWHVSMPTNRCTCWFKMF